MIQMKNIVREGHPSLREIANEVALPPSEDNIQLLNDMMTFLKNSQDEEISAKYNLRAGVGLAAPQLGINKRLIVIHFVDQHEKVNSYQLINPKIISHSAEQAYLASGEGCLSVDRNVDGYVMRYARITVKAFDIEGNPVKIRLRDYPAIVFQHEIDHLNGVMFFDHINKDDPFYIPENAKVIE
jgi:peptide deformylase